MTEEDRLRIILVAIATENYDAGYSADTLATCALDPKFDLGDLGADENLLREDLARAAQQYGFTTTI